jgi:NAD dependent epimerase/dehydratase
MSFWKGRKVLVTGGAGFIGSHLSERLVRSGAEVTVFTRYTSRGIGGAFEDLPTDVRASITVVMGDLRDSSGVDAAVAGRDVVFHLAAHIGIPYSYVHPLDVVQVNVLGTAHVLEACRRHGVSRLVCFSTSEVYGTAQYAPIDELHPLNAQSPYAASKVAADQLALSYLRSFGTPVTLCRPFNTYGPRQPARAVLPTIVAQALGSDVIRLGSLTPTRDLLFVEDTAAGAMRMAEHQEAAGETFNLATGAEITIGALADMVLRLVNVRKPIIADETRIRPGASEVMRLIGDFNKASRLIGWKPALTLEQGVMRTIEWAAQRPGFLKAQGYQV